MTVVAVDHRQQHVVAIILSTSTEGLKSATGFGICRSGKLYRE